MAKHLRPYKCPEASCSVRPFGDKGGLLRHCREVHRLPQTSGNPSQQHPCPYPSCKRHHNGFARKWNLIGHLRRVHQVLSASEEGIVKSAHDLPDGSSISHMETCHVGDSTQVGPDEEIGITIRNRNCDRGEETTQVLQTRVDELRMQKEEVNRRIDKELDALVTAINVIKERR